MPLPAGDTRGRIDVLVLNGVRSVVKKHVEPRSGGLPVWEAIGDLVEELIAENVSPEPVTAVRIGRGLGLLKKKKYVRQTANLD